jgi:hypothetical protein
MFNNGSLGTKIGSRLLGLVALAGALVVASPVALVFATFFIA